MLGKFKNSVTRMPVGFEELYTMYPMDFEEFILANGVQANHNRFYERSI